MNARDPRRCSVTSVGVIGAGRMGLPIIGHLARKGFTVVVHDVDAGKRDAVAKLGAAWAAGPRRRWRGGEVILVCVGYDREVRDLMAADGLLADLPRGTIVAILSTVQPRTVQELGGSARSVRRARGRFHRLPRRQRGGRGHAAVVRRRRCGRRRAPDAGARLLLDRHRAHRRRSAPRRWPRPRTTSSCGRA